MQPISHAIFWLTGIFLLAILFIYWYVVVGIIIVRWIIMRLVNAKVLGKLGENDLRSYIELFDILQLYYHVRFAKAALFKSKYRWD